MASYLYSRSHSKPWVALGHLERIQKTKMDMDSLHYLHQSQIPLLYSTIKTNKMLTQYKVQGDIGDRIVVPLSVIKNVWLFDLFS